MNTRIKKGDCVDIGVRYNGMIHWLYVRTVHKDRTITLEDIKGCFYSRILCTQIIEIYQNLEKGLPLDGRGNVKK